MEHDIEIDELIELNERVVEPVKYLERL